MKRSKLKIFEKQDLNDVVEFYHRRSDQLTNDELEEMEEMDIPPELLQEFEQEFQQQEEDVCYVLPENSDAVNLYISCYGHFNWKDRVKQRPILIGFERQALDMEVNYSQFNMTPVTWERFKILEQLTCQYYNK